MARWRRYALRRRPRAAKAARVASAPAVRSDTEGSGMKNAPSGMIHLVLGREAAQDLAGIAAPGAVCEPGSQDGTQANDFRERITRARVMGFMVLIEQEIQTLLADSRQRSCDISSPDSASGSDRRPHARSATMPDMAPVAAHTHAAQGFPAGRAACQVSDAASSTGGYRLGADFPCSESEDRQTGYAGCAPTDPRRVACSSHRAEQTDSRLRPPTARPRRTRNP